MIASLNFNDEKLNVERWGEGRGGDDNLFNKYMGSVVCTYRPTSVSASPRYLRCVGKLIISSHHLKNRGCFVLPSFELEGLNWGGGGGVENEKAIPISCPVVARTMYNWVRV